MKILSARAKYAKEHKICFADMSEEEKEQIATTENVLAISERLIKQNMEAYEILAK